LRHFRAFLGEKEGEGGRWSGFDCAGHRRNLEGKKKKRKKGYVYGPAGQAMTQPKGKKIQQQQLNY